MIKKYLPFVICSLLTVGICLLISKVSGQRIAYVNIKEVFDGFSLKIENEKKLKQIVDAHKSILDTMEQKLKLMSMNFDKMADIPKTKVEEFNFFKDEYLYNKKEFENQEEFLTKQYDDEIFKQLNQYMADYGKEHNFTLIFGAQGGGSVIYGQEKYDITKEVAEYINDKYLGK